MTFAALSKAPCAAGKVASAADVAAVATMLGEESIAVAVAVAGAAATAAAVAVGEGADGLTPEEGMLPGEGLTPGDGLAPGEEVLLARL